MDAKLRSLFKKVKKEHDDDALDRVIYATTVYILGFFAILIMAKQYVGEPLQCWIPAEYTSAWESYIEKFCFVENTYFVNNTIPANRSERKQYELRYYQWIPYLLCVQALLCYAPKLIFKLLYSFSDLRITDLIQLAYRECKQKFNKEIRISSAIATKLMITKEVKVRLHFDWYLTLIYLLMKVLFIAALVGQLLIMNFFVASSSFFWGFDVLTGLVNGQDWKITGLFPRVTFCDLKTRDLGQARAHTVQCVLMINMFAEKIYVFLWIWIYSLLLASLLNMLSWLYRTLSEASKTRMVKDALRLNHVHPSDSEIRQFIKKFLKLDGVLVLRLIDSNAGYVHMADILNELWKNYGIHHRFQGELEIGKMSTLVNKLLSFIKSKNDDDFVDRANYVYTATMFAMCALTILAKQYVGEPLQCWIPPHFKGSWEKYIENLCFVENTYFVNTGHGFPRKQHERDKTELGYYQWIPLLLATQMIACYFPKFLLSTFSFTPDFTIERLVNTAAIFEKDEKRKVIKICDDKDKAKKHNAAGEYLDKVFQRRLLKVRRATGSRLRVLKTGFYRSGATKSYIFYKILNLANSLGQVILLNRHFFYPYGLWGYGFLKDLVNEHRWKESGEFPRVTFCDVDIREIAEKPIKYTIQCVLGINMFIEKAYIFIWFWLLGLSLLNAINILYWLWCTHIDWNNVAFIERYLACNVDESNLDSKYQRDYYRAGLNNFVREYLSIDGVTTLRLLEINCGEIVTSGVIKQLWDRWEDGVMHNEDLDDEGDPDVYSSNFNNQMTQSTFTTSTSDSLETTPTGYSSYGTLQAAHQRIRYYPQSDV